MSKTVGIAFFQAAGSPPPPPTTPMDTYLSGMHCAYGLKKVLGGYSGPLLRVRRDSDNAEQDIGFVSGTGLIDTTALISFVGSGSGYVTKWYDQLLAVDAAQATTTKQPLLVSAGSYLGHLQFDGIDDYLVTHTPSVQALSFAGFIKLPSPPGSGSSSYFAHPLVGISGNALTCQYQHNNDATNTYIFTGTSSFSSQQATFSNTFTSIVVVCDRAAYPPHYYADGSPFGVSSSSTGTPTSANYTDQDLYIGSDGAAQPAAIQAQEFIIWTVNQGVNYFGIFGAL